MKSLDYVDVEYVIRLVIIGLQSFENRRLRGDLIETFKIIKKKVNASDCIKFSEGKYELEGHKWNESARHSKVYF